MQYSKFLASALSVLALAACGDESGVTDNGNPPPGASVRFVNAVPDTGTVDLRFVDRVENLPTLLGVAFQGHSGFYQRPQPGTRPARVFPSSSNVNLTQIMLVDTTLTLNADTRYTLVYAGRASGNQDRLAVLNDPAAPTPPANQIAIKVLHAAVGTGNVDVYIVPVASATAATPTDFATSNAGVVRNVSYLAQSGYVNVAVRPTTTGALYRFVVTGAGSTTPLFAATPNQPGAASNISTVGPQPGVQISGSALTVVVAPGSVAGTRQSTAANRSPTVFLMIDKVLNP